MKIGIDVSQLAFSKSGVANYLEHLVVNLLKQDTENEYVLFLHLCAAAFQIQYDV